MLQFNRRPHDRPLDGRPAGRATGPTDKVAITNVDRSVPVLRACGHIPLVTGCYPEAAVIVASTQPPSHVDTHTVQFIAMSNWRRWQGHRSERDEVVRGVELSREGDSRSLVQGDCQTGSDPPPAHRRLPNHLVWMSKRRCATDTRGPCGKCFTGSARPNQTDLCIALGRVFWNGDAAIPIDHTAPEVRHQVFPQGRWGGCQTLSRGHSEAGQRGDEGGGVDSEIRLRISVVMVADRVGCAYRVAKPFQMFSIPFSHHDCAGVRRDGSIRHQEADPVRLFFGVDGVEEAVIDGVSSLALAPAPDRDAAASSETTNRHARNAKFVGQTITRLTRCIARTGFCNLGRRESYHSRSIQQREMVLHAHSIPVFTWSRRPCGAAPFLCRLKPNSLLERFR